MCETCGCNDHDHSGKAKRMIKGIIKAGKIALNVSVNKENDMRASLVAKELKKNGILCMNIMGAPGSGKTTLIEGMASHLGKKDIAVIQGDLESDIDKKRLEKLGIYTFQINTHSGCHLNAWMIQNAIKKMKLKGKKYLIIENVGNLVCPAGVRLGQDMNIVVSSCAEGSDKPKKYPYIFLDADIVVVSKTDLMKAVGFDKKKYLWDVMNINSNAHICMATSKDKHSFDEIAHIIEHEREHLLGFEHHHMHHHGHH